MCHGSKAVRLVLGQDEWDSSLSQVSGTNAKHWGEALHLSKFFFDIVFFYNYNDALGCKWGGNGRKMGGEW